MSCSICNHPHRRDIDLALLSGSRTLRSLEQQYGPSRSSFCRHKNHLEDRLFRPGSASSAARPRSASSSSTASWIRSSRPSRLPPPMARSTGSSKAPTSAAAFSARSINSKRPWIWKPSTACFQSPSSSPGTASCPRLPTSSPSCTRPWWTRRCSPARNLTRTSPPLRKTRTILR